MPHLLAVYHEHRHPPHPELLGHTDSLVSQPYPNGYTSGEIKPSVYLKERVDVDFTQGYRTTPAVVR